MRCLIIDNMNQAAPNSAAADISAGAAPLRISDALHSALQHHQAGRLEDAARLYGQILRVEPDHADALHLSGVAAYQGGQYALAVSLLTRAIAADPARAEYRLNLGNALQAQGESALAISHYRDALALAPGLYAAHFNLGNALLAERSFAAAIGSYRQAELIRGDLPELYNNLGNAYLGQHQLDAAIESFNQALVRRPDYAQAHNNLGNALKEQGDLPAAAERFRHAIGLQAEYAEAYYNLANTLEALGQAEAAVAAYRQAVAIRPSYAEAHYNLGIVLQAFAAYEEAVQCYRLAIELRPQWAEPYNNLGDALANQGQLAAALESFEHAVRLKPEFDVARSNTLFHMNYAAGVTPQQYLRTASDFGTRVAARAAPYTHADTSQPLARLRIGFISGDLRTHPVGFFLESVVAHLDRQRFELVAYVTKPGEDAVTARIKQHFSEWHSLLGLSDAAAASKIHDDGIQILIDLAGHTADNRLPVMARKPAPVQVAWLGYFASTGVAAIDYILADDQVLPVGEESHFVETPWRLPDCYLCFTAPQDPIAVNQLPLLSNGYVTFGCFNKLSKMNDAVVALWARVLHAVPESRLVLQAKELSNTTARASTLERFAAHAIGADRIQLDGYTHRAAYLANYHRIDIALDPFPFPGGTTTVEALWMGVPVLSRRGSRFLSHAGESLLKTAGLAEWIAAEDEDYVRRAQAYAADVTSLAELRAGLRDQLLASPLCDAPRFAANLGQALNGMWQRYVDSAAAPAVESSHE